MWVWAFLITTIALAGIGFIFKFVEFVVSWAKSDGVDFALVPIATYLAVAAGYMCLFVWAWRRGMFKDIEAPKYRMLEMQDDFDAKERRP
ncbi:MAG: cbb3-type cytochrome oxidase assembly protein CcoS [Planctomycetes bacterium]|nr:cbb3-type cytochrome oxidase assembly protein CcoS [Planctomycetota bacterium]NOG53537.1 cbb3-type cytochrome oxidase assembly protein [Planctomycetota bacterium]